MPNFLCNRFQQSSSPRYKQLLPGSDEQGQAYRFRRGYGENNFNVHAMQRCTILYNTGYCTVPGYCSSGASGDIDMIISLLMGVRLGVRARVRLVQRATNAL